MIELLIEKGWDVQVSGQDSNGTLDNEELEVLNGILQDMFPRFGKGSLAYPNSTYPNSTYPTEHVPPIRQGQPGVS